MILGNLKLIDQVWQHIHRIYRVSQVENVLRNSPGPSKQDHYRGESKRGRKKQKEIHLKIIHLVNWIKFNSNYISTRVSISIVGRLAIRTSNIISYFVMGKR